MIKTIDECFFQIQNGANIKQGNADGGFPITRIETTANDKFNRDRMGYAGITDIVKYKKYILEDGDLLMSHINSMQYLGRTVLYVKQPNETIIHGMNLLRLKARRDVINPSYARYCFYGHKFRSQIGNITKKSVNQASFAVKDLKQIKIDIPSLDEQIKIAGILDKLQKLIDMRNEELEAFDNFVKSRFIEMFGSIVNSKYNYETCKLGEVAKVSSSHRVFTTEFVEKGISFYRGTEIGELANGQQPSNPYYISEEHYERLTNDDTKPQIGDLLMPSICNKGQVWMVDTQEPFYYKDGRVLCISPDKSIFNSKFLQYFMREKTLIEYPKLGSGSTFAEFKIFLLKELDVLVPPREIQEQFADFVAQTDKSKLAVQKSLDELETLKKSLMQEYFG